VKKYIRTISIISTYCTREF